MPGLSSRQLPRLQRPARPGLGQRCQLQRILQLVALVGLCVLSAQATASRLSPLRQPPASLPSRRPLQAAQPNSRPPILPPSPPTTIVNRWDYVTPNVVQPGPRAWHTAVNYSDSTMVVYGGITMTGVGQAARPFFECYR